MSFLSFIRNPWAWCRRKADIRRLYRKEMKFRMQYLYCDWKSFTRKDYKRFDYMDRLAEVRKRLEEMDE